MTWTRNRIVMLIIVVILGFALGRLAVRLILNMMLGGTMFGGNWL